MRKRIAIGTFLLYSALIALNTCQVQFNKSSNALTLRFLLPGNTAGGARNASILSSKAKVILPISQSLTVTISQGTTTQAQSTVSIAPGQSSVDVSFSSIPPGSYQVSAQAYDGPNGTGNLLSHGSTNFNVAPGTNSVDLTMLSNLLSNVVLADASNNTYPFPPPGFSPTTFIYNDANSNAISATYDCGGVVPFTLTLTTADPTATITSVTENYFGTDYPDSHTGSIYTLTISTGPSEEIDTATVVVTAQDGTTQTYTIGMDLYNGCT